MIFSKSFGYAVRGVLYITLMQNDKQYVQAEEIAQRLNIPRHFMSKTLKKLVKAGVIASSKGKAGGFTVNEHTLETLLINLYLITDGHNHLQKCVLQMHDCNSQQPCPLHEKMDEIKKQFKYLLSSTTIADLLNGQMETFLTDISNAQLITIKADSK